MQRPMGGPVFPCHQPFQSRIRKREFGLEDEPPHAPRAGPTAICPNQAKQERILIPADRGRLQEAMFLGGVKHAAIFAELSTKHVHCSEDMHDQISRNRCVHAACRAHFGSRSSKTIHPAFRKESDFLCIQTTCPIDSGIGRGRPSRLRTRHPKNRTVTRMNAY